MPAWAAPGVAVGSSSYPLFDRFPRLGLALARAPLGAFPTPVTRARSLGAAVGVELWVKRDDLSSEAYGGGKVRKLELFFGEAVRSAEERGPAPRELVTFGGVGSNQAVATAVHGDRLGFRVRVELAPQPKSRLVDRNLRLLAATQADVRAVATVGEALGRAERRRSAYVIPPGGTSPLGTLAFVSAGLELAADVRAQRLPPPRRLYAALGTGGSVVGLALGLELAGLDVELVAVRASSEGTSSPARLRAIRAEVVAYARSLDPAFPDGARALDRVRIDGRFLGGGYGVPTRAGDDAERLAWDQESLALDPVYTAKTLASVIADAKAGVRGPLLFLDSHDGRAHPTRDVPLALSRFLSG